ncbi:MAG: hypothetical protein H0V01_12435 [Bacteroidetes bacterium]|nr:hypothetical protein [Bacteroidota bacterium]HET6245868.1 kelch repeat-containing protein [Bacteroidia bacterium]
MGIKSPLPSVGRAGSSSMVINNVAYIIGGKTTVNSSINEVWAYTMANDTWIQKNNLPFGSLWRASATVHNGKGYLIFGKDQNESLRKELYEYDPATDTWNQISTFPGIARVNASLKSMDGSLVLVAGIDSLEDANGIYILNFLLKGKMVNMKFIKGNL